MCAEKANSRARRNRLPFFFSIVHAVHPVRSRRHESLSLHARALIRKLFYFQPRSVSRSLLPYTRRARPTRASRMRTAVEKKPPRSVYYALCHTYNILIRALQILHEYGHTNARRYIYIYNAYGIDTGVLMWHIVARPCVRRRGTHRDGEMISGDTRGDTDTTNYTRTLKMSTVKETNQNILHVRSLRNVRTVFRSTTIRPTLRVSES